MWISARDDRGGLMPMDDLPDETLTCLAIVAGLQGLSLREWIEKALRVALAREDAKATATEPPSRPGAGEPSIEVQLDEQMMGQLLRHFWSWPAYKSPGEALGRLLSYMARPSHIDIAWQLRGECPEVVAGALIDESDRHGETDWDLANRVEAIDRKAFRQALEDGRYDKQLRVAGVERRWRDVCQRVTRREVPTLVA